MKIMVDLDRVVFDCPSFIFWIGNILFTKTHLSKELKYNIVDKDKVSSYHNLLFFIKMSHSKNFTPIDKSVEVLKKWGEQGFEINFVTSRPNLKSLQKATVQWFNEHQIKYSSLIYTCTNKPLFCKINKYDVIIDDTYDNCVGASKLGVKPIWIRTKQNSKQQNTENLPEADNWSKIDNIVQTINAKQSNNAMLATTI